MALGGGHARMAAPAATGTAREDAGAEAAAVAVPTSRRLAAADTVLLEDAEAVPGRMRWAAAVAAESTAVVAVPSTTVRVFTPAGTKEGPPGGCQTGLRFASREIIVLGAERSQDAGLCSWIGLRRIVRYRLTQKRVCAIPIRDEPSQHGGLTADHHQGFPTGECSEREQTQYTLDVFR